MKEKVRTIKEGNGRKEKGKKKKGRAGRSIRGKEKETNMPNK